MYFLSKFELSTVVWREMWWDFLGKRNVLALPLGLTTAPNRFRVLSVSLERASAISFLFFRFGDRFFFLPLLRSVFFSSTSAIGFFSSASAIGFFSSALRSVFC